MDWIGEVYFRAWRDSTGDVLEVSVCLFVVYLNHCCSCDINVVDGVRGFYAPQLYRQVLLRRVLATGILSVCPSVTTRWYTKTR